MHKRKIVAIFLIIVAIVTIFASCKSSNLSDTSHLENKDGFSVHFIDVGQGDCMLICFPDGKTMLIDTGNGESQNNQKVLGFLDEFEVDKIDFLVLTHPDIDHIGGVTALTEKAQVSLAYVSLIANPDKFPRFKSALERLTNNCANLKISYAFEYLLGKDYTVAFLTPYSSDFSSSNYENINKEFPTERDINNVSPIIYVEYKGVRFLFTGDAGAQVEQTLLEDERVVVNLFNKLGVEINLDNVDYLKVSHHGADDGTTEAFIKRITPKNAVISVGGLNPYGHPSSSVLFRLNEYSPACNLFRTDVDGSISVFVDKNGKTSLIKGKA